ncbi:hypothetical protein BSZ22_12705 [Bradyrhizobium canariense]|nr:hypothetical protein BSZ22_12705 [Bradyrhizobium canariense]OSI79580.1 hypothetical protein BSZ23_14395 [Bradyrhizobium canariense]
MGIDVVWSNFGIVPPAAQSAQLSSRAGCLRVGRLPAGALECKGGRTHPLKPRAGIAIVALMVPEKVAQPCFPPTDEPICDETDAALRARVI